MTASGNAPRPAQFVFDIDESDLIDHCGHRCPLAAVKQEVVAAYLFTTLEQLLADFERNVEDWS